MSVTIYEVLDSGAFSISKSGSSVEVKAVAAATIVDDNSVAVELAIRLWAPAASFGLALLDYKADPIGGGLWMCSITYGPQESTPADPADPGTNEPEPDLAAPLGAEWSFTTTGGTTHITQSLFTRDGYVPVGVIDIPDYGGAIGVTREGIEGCDIVSRNLEFEVTKEIPTQTITMGYLQTLVDLTGTTNEFPFCGFDVGELLFLGATGRNRKGENWSVTYQFRAGKTKLAIKIGTGANAIVIDEKRPHDFLWVAYKDTVSGGRKVKIPSSAHAEVVYENRPFSNLGITI
ncbi:MAG: hypothetical protein ACRDD1_18135 [Planctomycetia bacterium]